jgi:hypothetical protein
VNLASCQKPTPCSTAEMDAATPDRPWGASNPRWVLFAYGAVRDFLPGSSTIDSPYYVVLLAGAAVAPAGWNGIALRAEAFGPRNSQRIEATAGRAAGWLGEVPAWRSPVVPGSGKRDRADKSNRTPPDCQSRPRTPSRAAALFLPLSVFAPRHGRSRLPTSRRKRKSCRKSVAAPAKVYTNKDPNPSRPAPAAARSRKGGRRRREGQGQRADTTPREGVQGAGRRRQDRFGTRYWAGRGIRVCRLLCCGIRTTPTRCKRINS